MFVITRTCAAARCNGYHQMYLADAVNRSDDLSYNTCLYCMSELGADWTWKVDPSDDDPCVVFDTAAEALEVIWQRGLRGVRIAEVFDAVDDKGYPWWYAQGDLLCVVEDDVLLGVQVVE